MVSLLNQLKDELTELFANREDSYKNTIVKKAYEDFPPGKYPRVIISEITNNSVLQRETSEGEKTSLLGYQFTVYTRDTKEYEKTDSANFMIDLIDNYIKKKYKMSRISMQGIQPYIIDSTVITNSSRYTCVYDEETNLIYTD